MLRHIRQGKDFYRGVFALMMPMILQLLVTNMLALADNFMVGVLGETELAAVTAANSLFFVVMVSSFGIQSGAAILVAQYYGRGNQQAINRVMGVGLYVSASLTALVSLITFFLPKEIMQLLTNDPDVVSKGIQYMRIVGFAYFFSSISAMYISVLRSMAMPKLGAIILSCSGILNILLNWILIFGKLGAPAMGVSGAAVATLICRVLELIAVCLYAINGKRLKLYPALILRPGMLILKDFLKYSLPVIINEVLWSSAIASYVVIMGHMENSASILAAHSVAGNIDNLLSVALLAASNATAIIVGREIGRGDKDAAYSKGVALTFLSIVIGLASSVLVLTARFFVVEQFVFPILDLGSESREMVFYMMIVIAIALPFRSVNTVSILGVFRGGGDVRFSLYIDTLPMYLICIPTALVLGLVLGQGIELVYICFVADKFMKVFFTIPRLTSRKWINVVTRENI